MAQRVVIRFPSDKPYEYYTNVFHFAEALWHPIVNAGLGKLNDIDRGREVIWIELTANRHSGTVKQIIKKALQKHKLADDATITVE